MSGPGSPSVRKKASKSPLRPLMPAPAPAKPVPPLPPRYGAGEAHASAHCRLRRAYAGVSLRQAYGSCWHRLAGDADEALEVVDQQRRDRPVEPVRAHEAAQELLPPALVVRLAAEQVAQLAEVLLERAGDDQRAAVLGEQVLEVEGLLLSALQLGEQDRVGPPADDRRIDQRRRVRADRRASSVGSSPTRGHTATFGNAPRECSAQIAPFVGCGRTSTPTPASSGSTRSASTQEATIGRSSAAMNPDEQT